MMYPNVFINENMTSKLQIKVICGSGVPEIFTMTFIRFKKEKRKSVSITAEHSDRQYSQRDFLFSCYFVTGCYGNSQVLVKDDKTQSKVKADNAMKVH